MTNPSTILHVVADEARLQSRSRLLRQAGYSVIDAQNSLAALQSARQMQPQLILLNNELADMPSGEICHRLKGDPATATSLILQLHAAPLAPIDASGPESPDLYLVEPVGANELLVTVTTLLRLGQAEAQLRAQQRAVQDIFATTPAILYIYDLVEQRNLYCTQYAMAELGLTEAAMATDQAPFIATRLHPDDQERLAKYLASLATLPAGETARFTYRQRHNTGDWHWFQSQSKIFKRTATGKPQQIIGVALDITEQKATEEAFYENYRLLQRVINSTSDGIYVRDLQGHYLLANSIGAAMIGLEPEGVIGKEYSTLFPAAVVSEIEAEDRAVLAKGEAQTVEVAYGVDGVTRTFHTVKTPYRDLYGNVTGILSMARDITERKQAEAQLRQLNEALEARVAARTAELERSNRELHQFAYIASHDLKAPLRAIDHLAAWLIEDALALLPAPSQEHLHKLRGRVKRMERLMDDLLAYSRAGRIQFTSEVVDVGELIRDITEMLAPPPTFVITTAALLPQLATVRTPLETVLRNLIGNAIKHHHRPDGHIHITAEATEAATQFVVEDDGPGIAPEFHQRIFELFQTLQSHDKVEGSGMGLAVVKKIVESYGGAIQVASQPNQGASFTFTWPTTVALVK